MKRHRHELTDGQWERIRDLLPGKVGDPGRTGVDNRLFVDAVLYVLKTGIPWDDLPARFGKPNTVWKRYDRWCANSIWQRIARALGDPDLEEVQLVGNRPGRLEPRFKKRRPAWGEYMTIPRSKSHRRLASQAQSLR